MSEQSMPGQAFPLVSTRPAGRDRAASQRRRISRLAPRLRAGLLTNGIQFLLVVAGLGIWQLLATTHVLNSFLYGSPLGVWRALAGLVARGELTSDISVTLQETAIGFVVGSAAGSLLGVGLWFSTLLGKVVQPFTVALNGVPKIALAPLLIVWFGAGMQSKIVLAGVSSFIVSLISTYEGSRQVDPDLVRLFHSYHATRRQLLLRLIIPATAPWAISALRINVGLALVGAVAGEFISSSAGLGHLVFVAGNLFETDQVLAGILVLSALAFLLYSLVGVLERRISYATR